MASGATTTRRAASCVLLDLAALRGTPPLVLIVGVGNASTPALLQLMNEAWPTLLAELARVGSGHRR